MACALLQTGWQHTIHVYGLCCYFGQRLKSADWASAWRSCLEDAFRLERISYPEYISAAGPHVRPIDVGIMKAETNSL